MVFILIGAVKAAKAAKLEYDKDKKRNAPIAPVDGSAARFRDGADMWYGACASASAAASSAPSAPSATSPSSTTAVSAWARQTAPTSPPSSASVSDDPPQPAPASPHPHPDPHPRPRPASSPLPASAHSPSSTPAAAPARHSASLVALPPSVTAAAPSRKPAAALHPAPAPAPKGSLDTAAPAAPRKRAPARPPAPDGSFDAARRAPVAPDGDATEPHPFRGPARATQVRRAEDKCADGSFAAAMRTQGEGKHAVPEGLPRRRPLAKGQGVGEDASACESAMPSTAVWKLRRRATVSGDGRATAEQRVPTVATAAYPAGSTAKRRGGVGGAGNGNIGDERVGTTATAAVESCMRKEGSMKKRVTRR